MYIYIYIYIYISPYKVRSHNSTSQNFRSRVSSPTPRHTNFTDGGMNITALDVKHADTGFSQRIQQITCTPLKLTKRFSKMHSSYFDLRGAPLFDITILQGYDIIFLKCTPLFDLRGYVYIYIYIYTHTHTYALLRHRLKAFLASCVPSPPGEHTINLLLSLLLLFHTSHALQKAARQT